MHVFKYSRREGTKAAVMPEQILPQIQEDRSKRLIELSDSNEINYNKKQIGKTLKVLFEEKDGEYIKGHTNNYILVNVIEDDIDRYHNKIKKVEIEKMENNELIGKIM